MPSWLAAEFLKPEVTRLPGSPPPLADIPIRQSEIWSTRIVQRDGKFTLELETLAGTKLNYEIQNKDLDELKKSYERRLKALEARTGLSDAEKAELTELRQHRTAKTGWASESPVVRAEFFSQQFTDLQPKVKVVRDASGRMTVSKILLGTIVITVVGGLLLSEDAPTQRAPNPTRSKRN